MTRRISAFIVGVFAVLTSAVPAEAQGWGLGQSYYDRGRYDRSYGRGYGYGGGYYDPATIEQMLSLPDGLASCQIGFSTGRVESCQSVIKTANAIQAAAQNPGGILGSIHIQKGKIHFRPFDDTNRRLGTFEAGALGAGAGALAGYGSTRNMRNRDKANTIGAVSTIGGGLLTGWLASRSRHSHNNCLIIEPTMAQSAGLVNVSGQEMVEPSPAVKPTAPVGGLSLRNDSGEVATIYDGSDFVTTLAPGTPVPVSKPESAFRAVVERFNERGQVEFVELGRRAEGSTLVFTAEGQVLPAVQ